MERRLAAILAADVVGYSRLMEADEAGTLERLRAVRKDLIEPHIAKRKGRVVKLMGDGLLAEFPSAVEAVRCAIDIQSAIAGHEPDAPDERRIRWRIGVNLGDIMIEDDDIYGDGVNVAARIEALALPGGIAVSGYAHDQVAGKLDVEFVDQGVHELKNIARPVRIFRVSTGSLPSSIPNSDQNPPLPDKPSIAVLPFTNMSDDPAQEHFADGIAEDIITALSKISKLFVVARNSTFTYKGRAVDVKQVGREQGVRYILEGSVQRGGDRLRITAQLIDAKTGHHVWAQRYNRATQDLFELQDEITREVASALQVELTEGEQARLWASGTRSLEAWEIAIQIPALLDSHRRVDVVPARRLAERALQCDPDYAAAWTMLGWSYWNEAFNGWTDDPDSALEKAKEAMERARSIDPLDPFTLTLLAFLHLSLRKHDEASSFIEQAIALDPNNAFAHGVAANVALYRCRPQEMIPLLKRAMRLCPIYPAWYMGDLSYAYLLLKDYGTAIAIAGEALKIDPDYIYAHYCLAVANAELDRMDEARQAVADVLRIEPKATVTGYAVNQPFEDAAVLDRVVDGLRKAGLPE